VEGAGKRGGGEFAPAFAGSVASTRGISVLSRVGHVEATAAAKRGPIAAAVGQKRGIFLDRGSETKSADAPPCPPPSSEQLRRLFMQVLAQSARHPVILDSWGLGTAGRDAQHARCRGDIILLGQSTRLDSRLKEVVGKRLPLTL
jgi:hypothetical protein